MKRALLVASVTVLTSVCSYAADLPSKMSAPAPAVAIESSCGVQKWSGFSAGINVGYVSQSLEPRVDPAYVAAGLTEDMRHDKKGMVGGVNLGYNFQNCGVVYGLDFNAYLSGAKGSSRGDFDYLGSPLILDNRSKLFDLYTARARLGYAAGNLLFYVAGGVAVSHIHSKFTATYLGNSAYSSDKDRHVGWTAGIGMGYKINRNWSTNIEYSFFDLGLSKHVNVSHDPKKGHLVKMGLSYHF